ncbi:hypothetical protein RI367_008178 [Sorochytrium milnesiophthora]
MRQLIGRFFPGSGWGATSVLTRLDKDAYEVTVISPSNNFFYTPLLPASCVGTIESRSLVESIRRIGLRLNAFYYEGEAEDVDFNQHTVRVKGIDGNYFDVGYDVLIVAVGSRTNTFGVKGVDEHCYFLKTVADSRKIRAKIMQNFEMAALPTTTPEQRRKLLSFVICGGGPTGVEVAAELHDFLKDDLQNYFPNIVRDDVTVSLIQSGDHILNTYDAKLSAYTENKFKRQGEGINIITNARVTEVQDEVITYTLRHPDKSTTSVNLPYGFCLWSTGIAMQPITAKINKQIDEQTHKRVLEVDDGLKLKGVGLTAPIYAIGDCATIENNHDGLISYEEFRHMGKWMCEQYPRAAMHLKKLDKRFFKYDTDGNGALDMEEFKQLLKDVDTKLKSLPATAQVASQQGQYLGKKLNTMAKQITAHSTGDRGNVAQQLAELDKAMNPFEYRHMGSLAYVGSAEAIADFGSGHVGDGLAAYWLWRGVYFSEQVSFRTRTLLLFDWLKRLCFGRDISRY